MKTKIKRLLLVGVIASSVIVFCVEILFSEVPEFFRYGSEIGVVLSGLSLAFISSYIFYRVVVIPKENLDKSRINKLIYSYSQQIVGRGKAVLTEVLHSNGLPANHIDFKVIEKAEFLSLCKSGNPNSISKTTVLGTPNNRIPASYRLLIHNDAFENVSHFVKEIMVYIPFLESDFIELINKIKESKFFISAYTLNYADRTENFSPWGDAFYEYLLILRELDSYNTNVILPTISSF